MKKNFYFILFSVLALLCTSCEKTLKEEPVYEKYYIKYTTNDWRTVDVDYFDFEYENNVYGNSVVLLSNTCEQGNGVITFMAKVTAINNGFLGQDNLTSIDLPGTITHINGGAFKECSNLQTVYIHSTIPPTLLSNYYSNVYTFYNCHKDLKIYIPAESEVAYKNASDWEHYKDKLVPTYY